MPAARIEEQRLTIPREEFLTRQESARGAAAGRGWPGIAVLGHGGGTYERHGDLLYLTGHYQTFPSLHDRPPLWSGRGYALLVLPVEGDAVLLCSAPEVDPDVAVDDVRIARSDFGREAAQLLEPIAGGGFVGFDVAPASMAASLPLDRFEDAQDVTERLRRRKSPAELAVLREACGIGVRAVERLIDTAQPGTREADAVAAAGEEVFRGGALPYLVALAVGDRTESYTGRPLPGWRAERPFGHSELARLDLVIVYEGYYCDFGRSWVIGGEEEDRGAQQAIDNLRTALAAAYEAARPGATAGDVARAGAGALHEGFSTAYPPHWGHGLGVGWEGPWMLPDSDEPLEDRFVLAIETTVRGFGVTVSGEDDLLVTGDGGLVLTPARWSAR